MTSKAYKLPKQYEWVRRETGPRIFVEAVKLLGVTEAPGAANNPTIMAWAKATGLKNQYVADSIPWCGLGMAYIALQAGWDIPVNPLWARNWVQFGVEADEAMLGDVLVFERGKGGHVGEYVGEDKTAYHVIGCNQDDMVNIKRIEKKRLITARRCKWRVNQPSQVRVVKLAANGALSTNEA